MAFHSEWLRNNPKGPHGPIPPQGRRRRPWVPLGPLGSPWVPLGSLGSPWFPLGSLGFPWVPLGPLEFPWVPLGSFVPSGPFGFPWVPMGPFHGTLGPAPVSRNVKIASREFGGGAGIAGACKQVGGYARSVDESIHKSVKQTDVKKYAF